MNKKPPVPELQPPQREVWLSAESLARLEPILRGAKQLTRTELWWLIGSLNAFQATSEH